MRYLIHRKNKTGIGAIWRPMAMVLLIFVMLSCLAGCSLSDINLFKKDGSHSKKFSENLLLTVNGIESDYREALLYLLAAKEQAEALYGEGIWDIVLDEKGTTYGKLRKEQVLDEYIELKIICANAGELGIELYEDENRDIASYTSAFIEKAGRAELMKYNISETVVKMLYVNNMTANKVYEAVTLSVDTNVSDSEARQGRYQFIYKKKYKEEDGERVDLDAEAMEQLVAKMNEIRTTAQKKTDFYNYALLNTEAATAEMVAGPGDFGTLSNIVMGLADGELSPVLETEDGFYIVKCVKAFDEEATAKKRESIVLSRQEAYFSELLEKWKKSAVVETDTEKWESLNP